MPIIFHFLMVCYLNHKEIAFITLLPKKDKDPLYIKNYRPITLLTVDYKMLAKCLANRLKRYMDHLIHFRSIMFSERKVHWD